MFRDDHEAALARIQALEAELARERAEDAEQTARIAELEHQLDKARVKLRSVGADVEDKRQQPNPKPAVMLPARPVATALPLPRKNAVPGDGRTAAIIVGVLLVAIVVVGLVMISVGAGTAAKSQQADSRQAQPAAQAR